MELNLKTGSRLKPQLFKNEGVSGKAQSLRGGLAAISLAKDNDALPLAIPFLPFTEGLKLGPKLVGPVLSLSGH